MIKTNAFWTLKLEATRNIEIACLLCGEPFVVDLEY